METRTCILFTLHKSLLYEELVIYLSVARSHFLAFESLLQTFERSLYTRFLSMFLVHDSCSCPTFGNHSTTLKPCQVVFFAGF